MEEDHNLAEYWGDDIIDGKRVERYLYALYVKEECLLCHGAKEQAPEFIRNNYDAGYDYKVGELRGQSVLLSQRKLPNNVLQQTLSFYYRRFHQYRVNRNYYFPDNREIYETD